jgi:hypothetical protein
MTGQLLDSARDDRQLVLLWARSWLSTLRVGEPWATSRTDRFPFPVVVCLVGSDGHFEN